MPSQGSDIRGVIQGGMEQAEPPRFGANHRFFHLHRSAGDGAASHLFTGSKTSLLNRVVIHTLLSLQDLENMNKLTPVIFKKGEILFRKNNQQTNKSQICEQTKKYLPFAFILS